MRWLEESLRLGPKLKESLLAALGEFMPDGAMVAALTEEQLRDEVLTLTLTLIGGAASG